MAAQPQERVRKRPVWKAVSAPRVRRPQPSKSRISAHFLQGFLGVIALTMLLGITECNTTCTYIDPFGNPVELPCVECSTRPVPCMENVWYLPEGSTCLEEQQPALDDGTLCGTDGVCEAGACRARSWGTAELIQANNTNTIPSDERPEVAIDQNGNAVAVWQQYDQASGLWSIWSNRYASGSGWGAPGPISTGGGDANYPRVAMDETGNAVATWQQSGSPSTAMWSNRYTSGADWGTPEPISTGVSSWQSSLAMDASGDAVALWQQSGSPYPAIWANRYTPATGWGAPVLIDAGNTGGGDHPQVAMDGDGNAMAVWDENQGVRIQIWSNRCTPAAGWGTAELVNPGSNTGGAFVPAVAIDASGNAIAVWDTPGDMWSNRYAAGTGWGTPEPISTGGGSPQSSVVMDANGNAIAVWDQGSIWSNRYTLGTGWGTAEPINTGGAAYPSLAMDANGNAVAVWDQEPREIWARRYAPTTGWGTAELIGAGVGNAEWPKVAMNPSGNAVAVWQQLDDVTWYIWANRYE